MSNQQMLTSIRCILRLRRELLNRLEEVIMPRPKAKVESSLLAKGFEKRQAIIIILYMLLQMAR
jgi:hypothetical protein